MNPSKNSEGIEEYWKDSDAEFPSVSRLSKRLVDGISIKDLCDGKEVMFELKADEVEYNSEEDEEIDNDIVHIDTKTMRENRGAPRLNKSFQEIASKMTNVTEDGLVKKQLLQRKDSDFEIQIGIENTFKTTNDPLPYQPVYSMNCVALMSKCLDNTQLSLITPGTGKTVPDNAYVTVHYNFYKENCEVPFDSTYLRNRTEKFRLGLGEVILGLEHAVKTMRKNENSMFFIKWELAFGELGCPDRIEKKCDIMADVTLINFVEVDLEHDLKSVGDLSKIDFTKYISTVKKLQCNGSDEFSKGETKNAISCYRRALRILNSLKLFSENEEKEMLRLKLKCLINLAVCYNKMGKPEQSCLVCQEALSIDQNNAKANFHYGRANLALSNFSTAKVFLLRANRLKPNDKEINNELKKLNDKKALFELKDRMFWTKAFKGEEKQETAEDETPSLKNFEENLMRSLEECAKEGKPYVLPMPLQSEEVKVCGSVAAQMGMEFESHAHFCVFKNPKMNSSK